MTTPVLVNGIMVSFSNDEGEQGVFYPENEPGGKMRPWVVLPIGADPGPAVKRAKARWAELQRMDEVMRETMQIKTAAALYDLKEAYLRTLCLRGTVKAHQFGGRWYITPKEMDCVFKGVVPAPGGKSKRRG